MGIFNSVRVVRKKRFTQTQAIILMFVAVIAIGSALLMLPISVKGAPLSFINALFTATSATCVTGLVVVDTYTKFTFFGQAVILLLIQIGGLGFMTIATLFSLMLRRTISLNTRLLIKESINSYDMEGITFLARRIVVVALAIELVGGLLLSIRFIPYFGFFGGLWKGLFHSVSAFCNAGFDLMGEFAPYSSLTYFAKDYLVNFVIIALIFLGGIGFLVILDVSRCRNFKSLRLHSKLTLFTTMALILFGFVMFFVFEYKNNATIGEMNFFDKIVASLFQSITPRTAGFNTVDYALTTERTKFITLLLMFIGGSPGSTAGGIKTVTVCILLLSIIMVSKGRGEVTIFHRRISHNAVMRAQATIVIALLIVIVATIMLLFGTYSPFLDVAFEVVSAFGTVGLSVGVTATLSLYGKIIMIILMFFGRIGVLSMTLAFTERLNKPYKNKIKYPEEKILVG